MGEITNPTGVLSDSMISIVDALVAAGVTVSGVFGPEHGFRGAAQAGSSEDTSSTNAPACSARRVALTRTPR